MHDFPTLPSYLAAKARRIKLVVFDVDGVLTDGTLAYSAEGEQVKHFNVKDGVGIKLLQCFDVTTAIISAKQSDALAKRASDLGANTAYHQTCCSSGIQPARPPASGGYSARCVVPAFF